MQFPGSGGSVRHPAQHDLTAHMLPATQTQERTLTHTYTHLSSSSNGADVCLKVRRSTGSPPLKVLFKPQWFCYRVLQSQQAERQSKVSAKAVSDHEHYFKRPSFQAELDFIKASCTSFTKSCKIQKQDCAIPFIAHTKQKEKGKLWSIKSLQKTLPDFNSLKFSSSFLFSFFF